MLNMILNWFGGSPLDKLLKAYEVNRNSAVEQDKVRAGVLEAQIASELERQKLANQVRLATSGFWEMRVLTFLTAAPFVLHAGAVGLDTTFGFGWRIAAYPAPFDQWEGAILLSFFGLGVAGTAIKAATAAFISRR